MPISTAEKELVIRCTILPSALYGCEASDVSQVAIQGFRSAIASTIGVGSARRSIDATFAFTQNSKDLDPHTHILYNTIACIRRVLVSRAGSRPLIQEAIALHQQYLTHASFGLAKYQPHGPINNLCNYLSKVGASIDTLLQIQIHNEMEIGGNREILYSQTLRRSKCVPFGPP